MAHCVNDVTLKLKNYTTTRDATRAKGARRAREGRARGVLTPLNRRNRGIYAPFDCAAERAVVA